MKKARPKKQHYISQYYFKNFGSKNNKIYVYDKEKDKFYWRNIYDVGEENGFFNLGIVDIYAHASEDERKKIDEAFAADGYKPLSEMTQDEIDDLEHSIDDMFSNTYEPRLSSLINAVINRAKSRDNYLLSNDEKAEFAYLLSLHYVRTKSIRDALISSRVSLEKQQFALMAQYNGLNINPGDISIAYTKQQKRLFHLSAIINEGFINSLSSIFYNYIWQFAYLDRGNLFLGDRLMSLCPTEASSPMFPPSFSSYGMIVEVPLNKRLLLIMSDRNKFGDKTDLECVQFNIYSEIGLNSANRNSVACSYKFVYSCDSLALEKAVDSFKKEIAELDDD